MRHLLVLTLITCLTLPVFHTQEHSFGNGQLKKRILGDSRLVGKRQSDTNAPLDIPEQTQVDEQPAQVVETEGDDDTGGDKKDNPNKNKPAKPAKLPPSPPPPPPPSATFAPPPPPPTKPPPPPPKPAKPLPPKATTPAPLPPATFGPPTTSKPLKPVHKPPPPPPEPYSPYQHPYAGPAAEPAYFPPPTLPEHQYYDPAPVFYNEVPQDGYRHDHREYMSEDEEEDEREEPLVGQSQDAFDEENSFEDAQLGSANPANAQLGDVMDPFMRIDFYRDGEYYHPKPKKHHKHRQQHHKKHKKHPKTTTEASVDKASDFGEEGNLVPNNVDQPDIKPEKHHMKAEDLPDFPDFSSKKGREEDEDLGSPLIRQQLPTQDVSQMQLPQMPSLLPHLPVNHGIREFSSLVPDLTSMSHQFFREMENSPHLPHISLIPNEPQENARQFQPLAPRSSVFSNQKIRQMESNAKQNPQFPPPVIPQAIQHDFRQFPPFLNPFSHRQLDSSKSSEHSTPTISQIIFDGFRQFPFPPFGSESHANAQNHMKQIETPQTPPVMPQQVQHDFRQFPPVMPQFSQQNVQPADAQQVPQHPSMSQIHHDGFRQGPAIPFQQFNANQQNNMRQSEMPQTPPMMPQQSFGQDFRQFPPPDSSAIPQQIPQQLDAQQAQVNQDAFRQFPFPRPPFKSDSNANAQNNMRQMEVPQAPPMMPQQPVQEDFRQMPQFAVDPNAFAQQNERQTEIPQTPKQPPVMTPVSQSGLRETTDEQSQVGETSDSAKESPKASKTTKTSDQENRQMDSDTAPSSMMPQQSAQQDFRQFPFPRPPFKSESSAGQQSNMRQMEMPQSPQAPPMMAQQPVQQDFRQFPFPFPPFKTESGANQQSNMRQMEMPQSPQSPETPPMAQQDFRQFPFPPFKSESSATQQSNMRQMEMPQSPQAPPMMAQQPVQQDFRQFPFPFPPFKTESSANQQNDRSGFRQTSQIPMQQMPQLQEESVAVREVNDPMIGMSNPMMDYASDDDSQTMYYYY